MYEQSGGAHRSRGHANEMRPDHIIRSSEEATTLELYTDADLRTAESRLSSRSASAANQLDPV